MKRLILILALTATLAWGIEVGGVAGFNYQSWNDGEDNIGAGFGLHAGILGGIGITPSCLPVYIGLESGFFIQGANYTWQKGGYGNPYLSVHLNNLVIPILLKTNFEPNKNLHLGAGLGPSFIIHTSGSFKLGSDIGAIEFPFNKDNLAADLGFQVRGELGIKLIPLLWFKPSVTLQPNGNPDNPFNQDSRVGSETTLFFTLGLALRI